MNAVAPFSSSVRDNERIRQLLPPVLNAAAWREVIKTIELSPRQAAYVALLMHGLEDKEISSLLGAAYGTLRTHRERALKRLGLTETNRTIETSRVMVTSRVFEIAWAAPHGTEPNESCPHCGRRRER